METIKTSQNVEFDVIYADGTRHHVSEGVLFGVENERIVFHNGTDRPEVIVAATEAAAEVIGNMNFPLNMVEAILERFVDNIVSRCKAEGEPLSPPIRLFVWAVC